MKQQFSYTPKGSKMSFNVRIITQKPAFGRTVAQIEPVSGNGFEWVNLSKLTPVQSK